MSKKQMLNLGVESYGADAPVADLGQTTILSVPGETLTVPTPSSQTEDIRRLQAIADGLDEVNESLGSRVARIGVAVIGGDTVVSTEAINLGNIGATVKRYVLMAIDFIKRFLVAVVNFGARFIVRARYNRKEMSDLQRDLTTYMRARRGVTFTVEGTAVTLLQINGNIPASPQDLGRSFVEFQRNVDGPYRLWLESASGRVGEIGTILDRVFKANSLLEASAADFDALSALTCVEQPKGWKRDVSVGSGVWSYVPPTPTFGGVRVNVVGDTTVKAMEVSASLVTPFEEPDQATSVALIGDLMVEYAKLGVGVVDAQINMAMPYDTIRSVSSKVMDKYTTKFTGVDERSLSTADQQVIATRNSLMNDAMGYLSFAMTSTANYMAYLAALRGAIASLRAVMEPA